MYEISDKVIAYLVKRIIRMFNNAHLIQGFDELNIIGYSKEMYGEIDKFVREAYELLAINSFSKGLKQVELPYREDEELIELWLEDKQFVRDWLSDRLAQYDPVTNYRYDYEIERKRERFVEAIISSQGDEKEFAKALKYLSNMVSQYAIEITRDCYIEGYKALGVERVMWKTQQDDRVCQVCKELDGNIYDIDKVPPLQHWNCRCTLIPVKE